MVATKITKKRCVRIRHAAHRVKGMPSYADIAGSTILVVTYNFTKT